MTPYLGHTPVVIVYLVVQADQKGPGFLVLFPGVTILGISSVTLHINAAFSNTGTLNLPELIHLGFALQCPLKQKLKVLMSDQFQVVHTPSDDRQDNIVPKRNARTRNLMGQISGAGVESYITPKVYDYCVRSPADVLQGLMGLKKTAR